MIKEDLVINFEKQRKRGEKERRKSEMQRQKQHKKKAIPPISEPRDASLLEEESHGTTASSMDPELYRATTEGDILEFIKAIERGPANLQPCLHETCVQVSPQKNTVLHIATSFGHGEIVKLICKDLPFLVFEKNSRGDTALHIAARAGNTLLVSLLVNSIESVLGEKNDEGNTALHEALRHHRKEVAWNLINKDQNMTYSVNKEGKSILYLAAEAAYPNLVKLIMDNPVGNCSNEERLKNKSPVHAAILGRNIDVLNIIWEKDQSSFNSRCEEGRNPLHYAASIGYVEGVDYLLERYCVAAYQRDKNGFSPIHIASCKGHINIIQEMLRHCPDMRELLNQQGQNILHIAAKSGKAKVVSYILKTPKLEKLINERDEDGNTPLHLATNCRHPRIVSTLTWDPRVNLMTVNNKCLTAFDIAEHYNEYIDMTASFRKRLTWAALRVADAPRAQPKFFKSTRQNSMQGEPQNLENFKDKYTVILLVATLVATVTFSAGFTIPGGDNNSKPDPGMATMLIKKMFHVFVICNTIAMYSSIFVAVTLIWAQLGDHSLVLASFKLAMPLLGVALTMMSMAFMAGIHLVVSKLSWLADVVLFMGFIFLVTLLAMFVPLCFLTSSNYHNLCYISYYPYRLVLFIFGNYIDDDMEE